MEKIIIAPDSFKGTMTSREVCAIVGKAVRDILPDAKIIPIPIADGGEGSAECFLSFCGGEAIKIEAAGPFFDKVNSFYVVLPDGTAVVEAATCAGLTLAHGKPSASGATTYGVGEQILDAVRRGAKKILLCLGGVATNDGGCGMAAALGVKFYRGGETFVPTGRTLSDIDMIDVSITRELLAGVEINVLCDVKNRLYGPDGAARVYARQKGATDGETEMLDEGLKHLSDVIRRDVGVDISSLDGAGAAGGMGGGAVAFLGATPIPGIDAVLDAAGFDKALVSASLVITGEGQMDAQSAYGKAISGVAKRAHAVGVPVYALVGKAGDGAEKMLCLGVNKIYVSAPDGATLDEIKKTCRDDLYRAAVKMMTERSNEK
ncbi:MAG: glycerate kinase [Clostridia bacterium]|nr:glycerate kinase [Clostridia bacterium]